MNSLVILDIDYFFFHTILVLPACIYWHVCTVSHHPQMYIMLSAAAAHKL